MIRFEIDDIGYCSQIHEAIKPIGSTGYCRAIYERSIKYDTCNTLSLSVPTGASCKRPDTHTIPLCLFLIIVERQYGVVLAEDGVGFGLVGFSPWLCASRCEIARICRSAIDVGVGVVGMIGIVIRASPAFKVRAAYEHVATFRNYCRTPFITCIDGRQVGAGPEHIVHVLHISRIEFAHVKARQARTVEEHTTHVCHISRIEFAHVKVCQARAAAEHAVHVFHVVRIKARYVEAR